MRLLKQLRKRSLDWQTASGLASWGRFFLLAGVSRKLQRDEPLWPYYLNAGYAISRISRSP
jgi:hypothetical protein